MKKEKIYLDNIISKNDKYTWSELNCFYRAFANVINSYDNRYYEPFLILTAAYVVYVINGERILTFDKNDHVLKFWENELKDVFNIKRNIITYRNKRDMVKKLYVELAAGNTIVMPCDLFYLPYSKTYLELHKRHYLIIKGIDVSKNIVYILDNMHENLGSSVKYSDFMMDLDVLYNMNDSFKGIFDSDGRYSYFWSTSDFENEDYNRKISDYMIHMTEKIIKLNIDNSYECNVINLNHLSGEESIRYMEYINTKKFLFTSVKEYIKNNYNESVKTRELIKKIDTYINEKEKNKIYTAMLSRKVNITEKNEGTIDILSRTKNLISKEYKILSDLSEIIKSEHSKIIYKNSGFCDFKIINNKNLRVDFHENICEINTDADDVYDIWKNVNNGVVLYKENRSSEGNNIQFGTDMTIICDSGASNHAGIILESKNGEKILFGSLGRLNMAVYILNDNPNYEYFFKAMPFEQNIRLDINADADIIRFYVNDKEVYAYKKKFDISKYGVFVKTWHMTKCGVRFVLE